MSFANPALLALGLVVAVALACAAVTVARRRAAALASAGIAAGGPGRGRDRARDGGVWFTIAGVGVLAIAVAGPAASVPVTHASGTVVLAMDVSGSMAATDVAPNRLAAAKQAALSFISAQPDSVDIGVVAFQDGGLEAALPTADHATASAAVRRLTAGGGTSLGGAILASLAAITHKTVTIGRDGSAPDIGYWPSATVVLFSDGQDEAGDAAGGGADGGANGGSAGAATDASAQAAASVAQKAGVHIDTVGVGTTAGATVEVDGYHLFTALDPATLTSIAQATGGTYHPASDASELDGIASSINLRLTVVHEPLPLAGAFIALALALLAVGAVLTVARTGRVV
jgi:Ca-activated chloride channel family protein